MKEYVEVLLSHIVRHINHRSQNFFNLWGLERVKRMLK